MPPQHRREAAIRSTWQRNAAPWTAAVRGQRIDSRRRVTDQAVVDAVTRQQPTRVLDDGRGEGFADPAPWHFRTLASGVRLFADHGLPLIALDAPAHPVTGRPASVILTGRRR
ncbi:MAG: hypothetical protein Kow0073_11140 [Immundisolibacter sp.]